MKKTIKYCAMLLALCMVFTVVLAACQNGCTKHKDANGDGSCDVCGTALCALHVDLDGDGVCNNCGSELCEHHKDLDSNGICDNCGAYITICNVHTDTNGDSVCDNCGVRFICVHKDSDNDGTCDKCSAKMPTITNVQVVVSADKTEMDLDDTLELTVSVTGTSDTNYVWSFSKENIIDINNNVVSVVNKNLAISTYVVVTATSTADPNASGSWSILVKVPTKEGQVGELTSAMLAEIGNPSITVTGKVVDNYIDNNSAYNSWTNTYSMTVQMDEGLWYGAWNGEGTEVIADLYGKGTEIVKNESGQLGNALVKYYIDKDNNVATKNVTNYNSIPALWETQHMWNHLANLDIDKITYDAINEVYEYNFNRTNIDDLYFMTYLSYSLTPMLEDTLDELYLYVENGHITKMLAKTETVTYPEDAEQPDAISYTTVELSFSNIGTTVVTIPEKYNSEGDTTAVLQNALSTMAGLTSYTFKAVETVTSAPVGDDSDYELMSVSGSSALSKVRKVALKGSTSAVGEVGLQGWVTPDAVLLCRTGKYSYTMDDRPYWTEYYGYKQIDANHYDYFQQGTYKQGDVVTPIYIGTKSHVGTIADILPGFNFAAELFTCTGATTNTNTGKTTYTYKLLETAICRDIAMQLGMYYAEDSQATLTSNFTITVEKDADGNCVIKSVKYPYSITMGTYVGYITVTYSNLNTTQLPTDNDGNSIFEDYEARKIPDSWSETETKYYSPNCSSSTSQTVNSEVALRDAFGDKYDSVYFPQYKAFYEAFGDDISGPFYEYDEKGTDVDGNTIWKKYICLTLRVDEYDENMKITVAQYENLMNSLAEQLAAYNFEKDPANTDTTGGATGYNTKYYGFINTELGMQIKVESNGTRNFWIYIYNMGDYSLNRG